jgi:hypothetical protein
MTFHMTGGDRRDSTALSALLDTGAVRRKRGRPRRRPVAGDKAFAGQPSRTHLRSHGIKVMIPLWTTGASSGSWAGSRARPSTRRCAQL